MKKNMERDTNGCLQVVTIKTQTGLTPLDSLKILTNTITNVVSVSWESDLLKSTLSSQRPYSEMKLPLA
jgi:hypothetical protein